ncbi:hypothetical protein C8R44DRAFT_787583, partial [Mycena epipterygia]
VGIRNLRNDSGFTTLQRHPSFAVPDYDPGPAFNVPPSDGTVPPSSAPVGSFDYDVH